MNAILYTGSIVFLAASLAGFIQTTAGFASGIIMMLFFPLVYPMIDAVSLSTLLCALCAAVMGFRYRKFADYKQVLLPLPFYLIPCYFAVNWSKSIDVALLKIIFGGILIAAACYFAFFSDRIKLRAGLIPACICGATSGTINGLLSVGGPPMAIYYMAACEEDKNKYLANSQMFFLVTYIYSFALRAAKGFVSASMSGSFLVGAAGIVLGFLAGKRLQDKFDIKKMKQLIYLVLAFCGIVTIAGNI
ncbi:MAG: sulfite exporter TauE/SafE family protein [Oscillospiraceae bacterium]|nr:sulfite exporter TauE/SafE family protein [Oscillospiraceae bacterium]